MNLTLPGPTENVNEITNVGATKGTNDPITGNSVVKEDNNRPKLGSNARAMVKEVRQAVRETVKDVRQGVRDVVKSVTGLGKKKDESEKKENPAPPKPE